MLNLTCEKFFAVFAAQDDTLRRTSEDAVDPAGGWYGRSGGRLNGWLYEHAYWLPQVRTAAKITDAELRTAIEAFESEALSHGITSVQTMPTVAASRVQSLLASTTPRLRWRVMDFRMAPYSAGDGSFPVKYVLDGTPIERSVAMLEPES